jgi:hypothetical protein
VTVFTNQANYILKYDARQPGSAFWLPACFKQAVFSSRSVVWSRIGADQQLEGGSFDLQSVLQCELAQAWVLVARLNASVFCLFAKVSCRCGLLRCFRKLSQRRIVRRNRECWPAAGTGWTRGTVGQAGPGWINFRASALWFGLRES